jgi:hypothetical protein
MRRLTCLLALAVALGGPLLAAVDEDALREAKALFFDREYTEAREAWQQILDGASGSEAETAAYWVARCSEKLGEPARALKEYGAYLDRGPTDPTLAQEARISRVGLAARLYKSGQRQHLPLLKAALSDPSKTVRYFAALQLAGLGSDPGRAAVPVLREIVEVEDDPDLRDRAQIMLLRVAPEALRPAAEPRPQPREARRSRSAAGWIKLRIYDPDQKKPALSINLPLALAELVFKALPDEARRDLREEGYDVTNFWEKLEALGPTGIIEIEGEDGTAIKIWLE